MARRKLKPVGALITAALDAARELKKIRHALLFSYRGSIDHRRLVADESHAMANLVRALDALDGADKSESALPRAKGHSGEKHA